MIQKIEDSLSKAISELYDEAVKAVSASSSCIIALECIKKDIYYKISEKYPTYINEIDYVLKREASDSLAAVKSKNKLSGINISEKISNKCRFDLMNYKPYQDLIFTETETVKKAICCAGTAVGGAAVGGGILLAISSLFHLEIPAWIIIASSAACGLGAGATTAVKFIPDHEKKELLLTIKAFLEQLKIDLLQHLDEFIVLYKESAENIIVRIKESENE